MILLHEGGTLCELLRTEEIEWLGCGAWSAWRLGSHSFTSEYRPAPFVLKRVPKTFPLLSLHEGYTQAMFYLPAILCILPR